MQISLDSCRAKLSGRLDYLSSALAENEVDRITDRRVETFSKQEGLVSSLWQSWAFFCKSVILNSLAGATTATGGFATSPFAAIPLDELREHARRSACSQSLSPGKTIKGDHLEPTWGDIRKATLVINSLQPSNAAAIQRGLGVLTFALDLQIVRNAAAHLSPDRIADIRNMQLKYAKTSFRHPTDALYWIEPTSNVAAWRVWIDEMRSASTLMVS